jgi:hypothetical protein
VSATQYGPRTAALRRVLDRAEDPRLTDDLLYLEAWEMHPAPGPAAALRVGQIRRANPRLAAEIRAELTAEPRGDTHSGA